MTKIMRALSRRPAFYASLLGAALLGFASPAVAVLAANVAWLDQVETGLWEIRDRNTRELVDKVCVRDPKQLVQLRHGASLCPREVLRQDNNHAFINYKCGSRGHGYTTLTLEGSNLMQINSQGLFENAPFNFSAEARRVGKCG